VVPAGRPAARPGGERVVVAGQAGVLAVRAVAAGVAAVPNPAATQPPGTAGLTTLLNWGAWVVTLLCVAGVLLVAAKMAVSHRRGEGSEAVASLGWVMGGCVLAASSAQLVNALL